MSCSDWIMYIEYTLGRRAEETMQVLDLQRIRKITLFDLYINGITRFFHMNSERVRAKSFLKFWAFSG